MKLAEVASAAVPDEEVLAAGIFRAGGSLSARMSGFGEFSVRRREREVRDSSGLAFRRYMLLVVTPTRLHLFDARARLKSWKAGRLLASWDRSQVHASSDRRSVTIRLLLEIPSESRRLELEAPSGRRATAGEVVRVLVQDATPTGSPAPATPHRPSRAEREDASRIGTLHKRVGKLAMVGGVARLCAYAMPWIVLTPPRGSWFAVDISGYRELGSPVISIGYSILIIVAALFFLAGRREASPRLLRTLGIGSVIVFIIQFSATMGRLGPLRTDLAARPIVATVSLGFGVWVELAGAILTLVAGMYAVRLSRAPLAAGPEVAPVSHVA